MCKFPADYFSQNGIFFHVLFLLPVYPYLCFMVTEQFVRDVVVATAKVQIFKQITTGNGYLICAKCWR